MNFLDEAAEKYGFDRDNIIAIGYSNGANIAASLLFHYQNCIKGCNPSSSNGAKKRDRTYLI